MFKDIPNYRGMYKIDEFGNVMNSATGKILAPALSNTGYLRVGLVRPWLGDRKNESIHRLVATTFIPNPNNLPVVMHLDNNKTNNHVSNLKWGTYSENTLQAFREGRKSNNMVFRYTLSNDITGDEVMCSCISDVLKLTGYKYGGISTLNRKYNGYLQHGPYKGYKITRDPKILKRMASYI